MKRYLIVAVVGLLAPLGASAQHHPALPPAQMPNGSYLPPGAVVIQGHPAPAMIQQMSHGGGRVVHQGGACCAPVSCEPACEKVCVPVPDKKKVTKYVYDVECKDYCLKRCPPFSFSMFRRGCDSGCCGDPCGGCAPACQTCGDCERVRTKRVLIKKKCETEECTYKCEVQHRAPCAPACNPCPAPCGSHGTHVVPHGTRIEVLGPPGGTVPPMPPAGGKGGESLPMPMPR